MKKITIVIALFVTINLNAQDVVDKIAAVIGDEIILNSELEFQLAMYAAQRKMDPQNPELKKILLNKMIEDKLLYAQALLDSIEVTDEDVNRQLEQVIAYYTSQYGSQERLEEAYGMSVEKIKREMKDDTKKNLMAEMLKGQKFAQVDVTRREVQEFFETYQDSLGLIAEKFEIAHIFINPKSSDKLKKKARDFAQALRDSISKGANFEELAKKNSDDPGSAKAGGDLGFVKRGVFYPEFESAAFALKEGELSNIVESPVGFHIIELIEKRGESIRARHILIKPKSDDAADIKAIEELTDLRDSILSNKNTFDYYAAKFSNDKETAKFGGVLGTFEAGQLEKPLLDQVYKLHEGEISFPKRLEISGNEYGFHIIKLIKRIPEHKPNLETDYNEIKKITEFRKREKLNKEWIDEIKEKVFLEVRI
ncbi:MAG: peptidylprolyl isomerase [Ignavibacteriae bacterium]|nr:peptidylprolyl isomerase [Ignavibacteriota bacterium]